MTHQNPSFLQSLLAPLSRRLSGLLQDDITKTIDARVQEELLKRQPVKQEETFQYNIPPWFNLSPQAQQKPKPEGRVSYALLRNFSIHYPVARSCIDYLKTKILKLDYSIVSADPSKKLAPDDPRVIMAQDFFWAPLGKRSHYRQLIESIIEDYLVVGAFCLERMQTRGGQFMNEVKLVDASTIQILIDQYGRLPEPPDPAFQQVINGELKVKLTQDDLIYVPRGYRTSSPYGISPIESIIVQAESALQGARYSLSYFTDGNVPEGFGEMPDGWDVKKIREFQDYFDTLIAGNPTTQRKIKMVPKGFNYQPTKKPDALGFDRFEGWLLQQTCSVFGVPPQDIGFTYQVNKATGEVQQELGEERGMRGLAQLLEQVFTDIVTDDMGFEDLRFRYNDLDPTNAKEEAEVMEIKLRTGVVSVDEVRAEEGLDPIGLGPYVLGTPTLVSALKTKPEDQQEESNGKGSDKENDMPTEDDTEEDDPEMDEQQKLDMRTWMKQSKNAFKQGRPFKKFVSNSLEDWMVEEVFSQLQKVKKKEDIETVFDPYFNNQMQTVKVLEKLTHVLTTIHTNTR